ncbi:hypothetical protein [Turicimonas muris]|uniref:hypothetical protein n=1 Tax=Turicimonas muris TaxID=1796652 RepID=UPI002617A3BF|nr:hypothetical protein [Turicimonas muris]
MPKQYIIVEHDENDNVLYVYTERFNDIVDAEQKEASYIYGYTSYYEVIDENDDVMTVKQIG